eukprot:TRINITY_DN9107_c0_g2_i1.p1 TRINITY_DN9107_c0_g2~~TRINITY_DN9107_c0_g2_i1.p1  ORF type:complete len:135 (-),score=26.32 TRINITY_DN9107_c0_g2_i1:379-783(-)
MPVMQLFKIAVICQVTVTMAGIFEQPSINPKRFDFPLVGVNRSKNDASFGMTFSSLEGEKSSLKNFIKEEGSSLPGAVEPLASPFDEKADIFTAMSLLMPEFFQEIVFVVGCLYMCSRQGSFDSSWSLWSVGFL